MTWSNPGLGRGYTQAVEAPPSDRSGPSRCRHSLMPFPYIAFPPVSSIPLFYAISDDMPQEGRWDQSETFLRLPGHYHPPLPPFAVPGYLPARHLQGEPHQGPRRGVRNSTKTDKASRRCPPSSSLLSWGLCPIPAQNRSKQPLQSVNRDQHARVAETSVRLRPRAGTNHGHGPTGGS